MLKLTLDKRNKKDYIVFLIFSILSAVSIVYCLIFPRGRYICKTLILTFCWAISFMQLHPKFTLRKERDYGPQSKPLPIFIYLLITGVLYISVYLIPIVYLFECVFPYRWSWEYKNDIKELKEASYETRYFFPDELPECAQKVQWKIAPGYMQAHGYEALSFVADDEYIQECIEKYGNAFDMDNYILELPDDFDPKTDILYENYCYINTYDFQYGRWPENVPGVTFTEEELATATQYDMSIMSSYCYGFVVAESSNRIVFYHSY